MSFLSDALAFDRFALKDIWRKVKDDPERLLIGAGDPISTKMWNKITGKNYEPLVDQFGGPYGGHTISAFGNNDGGVYARAEQSGINTKSGRGAHDAAHILSAVLAGGYGLGAFGGGGAGGAASGASGSAGAAAGSGGIPAGMEGVTVVGSSGGGGGQLAGLGAITPQIQQPNMDELVARQQMPTAQYQTGFDWKNFARQMQSGGGNQQQEQTMPAQTLGQRIRGGLGRIGDTMFPVDQQTAGSMTADQLKAMRKNALLQMGLGMMSASARGARFGEALGEGYFGASSNLEGAMQRAYRNAVQARAETREIDRENRNIKQQEIENERADTAMNYRMEQDRMQLEQRKAEQEAQQAYRQDAMQLQQQQMDQQRAIAEMRTNYGLGKPPQGYRYKEDGSLEFIKGGPADPEVQARASNPSGKLTEGEQRALSYISRMKNAESNLQANGYAPQGMGGAMNTYTSLAPGGNLLVTENYQKYLASAREWIAGMLRYDSGAAVPDSEFKRYFNTWFAQPGDSADVIAQKEQQRQVAIQSIESGLSPSARQRVPRGATGRWSIEEVQ